MVRFAERISKRFGLASLAFSIAALTSIGLWAPTPSVAQTAAAPTQGEWRYYGSDAASTKYSPLDQINRDNVKNLRIAWTWKTENFGPRPEFNFQETPLMVNGVLYFAAGTRRTVVAVNAATGETLWMYRFDEGTRGQAAPRLNHRGVAY
jgi:quinoprotein glucose dehydrogenase